MTTYQGTFRKLIVWQSAKELAKDVYRLANKFPAEEKYGLASQMKRAAISIMSNIAEGNQRAGRKEMLNFLNIAFSSLTELDCQSDVAFELEYITKKDYDRLLELLNKTAYLLFRLIESKKNPNSLDSPNSPKSPTGFSLMELLVVIAIIAVVSVASVVGFRGFSASLITKEAKGVIEDTVKSTELEVLQGDYKSSRISFLEDYLVIESAPDDKTLSLTLDGDCPNGRNIDFGSSGTLTKKDGLGNILSARAVVALEPSECIEFTDSKEAEWVYQITSGDEVSDVIRFVHFNVNRETPSEIILGGDTSKTLSIEAPYAKKTISDGSDSIVLTVSGDGSEEALTIK